MLDEFVSFVPHKVLPANFNMSTLILYVHCLNLPQRSDQSVTAMPHDRVMLCGATTNLTKHAKLTALSWDLSRVIDRQTQQIKLANCVARHTMHSIFLAVLANQPVVYASATH